jgi:hypothetical protein
MIGRRPLMALGHPALTLSPLPGRGDGLPLPLVGEGWGGVAWGHAGEHC